MFRVLNQPYGYVLYLTALLLLSSSCKRKDTTAMEPVVRDPVAQALWDLTGKRTRIVWLQDTGDGADYLARGTNLQLVVLDTDDGRGERIIRPPGRNMAKPMFTVDGERIIFSDRHNGTMHIINRDGTGRATLGKGFALHTWRDPDSDVEWLYYARNPVDDGKILPTHEAIYRKALAPRSLNIRTAINRLVGRGGTQRVWTQTPVSEDSFQLSADGRFASAAFPWPEVGVLDTEAGQWNRLGRGCWVALSPDNDYLFWVLDGPHRNITLFDAMSRDRWTVSINHLPGTERYEVYHPRWSNHPRIMAVSGPYKVGEGAYRLPGGGADVEIHVGRFSEDHRNIEHWVRATYNNYANFYPDIWVEPDPLAPHRAAAPDIPPRRITWPLMDSALIYLWEHGAAQNEVTDAQTGKRRIFRPEPRGLARYGHRHEMWLAGGYFIDEHAPPLPDEFTIECVLRNRTPVTGEAPVMGYGSGFGLFEANGRWVFRYRDHALPLGDAACMEDTHLVLSATRHHLRLYINGELSSERSTEHSIAPPTAGAVYFGGHPGISGDWPGTLSHIALYGRALDAREAIQHYRLIRDELDRHPPALTRNVRARVVSPSAIPTPEDIAPYRRALVVNEYEVTEGERAGERFLAAHWAILDGRVLDTADRPLDAEYELTLALFEKRPELEGERLAMDSEDITLRLFYDLNL